VRRRCTAQLASWLISTTLIAGSTEERKPVTPHPDLSPTLEGFVENRGQIDSSVRFYARNGRAAVYFTATGPVLEIRELAQPVGEQVQPPRNYPIRARERRHGSTPRRFAVGVRLVGAGSAIEIEGVGVRQGRHSYLLGNDPRGWVTGVRTFDRIVYRDVWPRIDLEYHLDDGRLVYEIVPGPGADLSRVKFDYDGAAVVEATSRLLRLETPLGVIEDRRPSVDDRTGEIRFAARAGSAAPETALPETDSRSREPAQANGEQAIVLLWSSFLGGERDDTIFGVSLDANENPVVTGTTRSVEFPAAPGVLDTDYNGSFDVFVTKFAADGSTLLWSTFLGDDSDDRGWAIQLDAMDRPIVAGVTASASFPTTPGAYDTTYNGGYDAFVAKLTADGDALVWSSFVGGSAREWDISGLDQDAAGRPTLIGSTRSADLPTTPGAHDVVLDGGQDAFVLQLEADGSALAFSTYLGGEADDIGEDVVLDATGRPVVVGRTSSADFPTTPGAFQTVRNTGQDGFVTKLTADAGSLVFSTFLGGDGSDACFAAALDDTDRVMVIGGTESTDFPTTPGSYQEATAGVRDVFVSKLESDGTALAWSSYFGGEGFDDGFDIVADSAGRPIFVGSTCSLSFPTAGPPWDGSYNFACDAFVAKLDEQGTFPVFSTFIGGNGSESAFGLALGPMDRPYVGGVTRSETFPTTSRAYDPTHNSPGSWTDAFLFAMFTPRVCTVATGLSVPQLLLSKAASGVCPDGTPEGNLVDLIEGRVDQLSLADIGVVEPIACASPVVSFRTDTLPAPGGVLFHLARYSPAGTYADGGDPGIVGSRTPTDGDCP